MKMTNGFGPMVGQMFTATGMQEKSQEQAEAALLLRIRENGRTTNATTVWPAYV